MRHSTQIFSTATSVSLALLLPLWVTAAPAAEKLKVVATNSIIGDMVQTVAGNDATVTTLVGPDGDPHDYQWVPRDSIKLTEAAIIFENGLGLEVWLDKLAAAARTSAARVVVTAGVEVRRVSAAESGGAKRGEDDRDPHAWQNVQNAVVMVGEIRDALIKTDPDHAAGFRSRADAYDRQLTQLDADIAKQIQSLPPARRKLVTSHDAFGYFGQRYGLDISGSALESITTEASDPSARQIAQLVDAIRASHVPVIFLENIQNPKLTQQIASDAGVSVGPPLYSDALGKPGTDGDTYLKMMRYNADTLVKALRP